MKSSLPCAPASIPSIRDAACRALALAEWEVGPAKF